MNDDRLDALLARGPDAVSDDGFSARVTARVTARIAARQAWNERIGWIAPALCGVAVAPFLPWREVGEAAMRMTPLLANSAAVAIAAAALVLTFSLDQRLRQ